ncbi:MAG: two-component regulator propeller domain-containing protein, partial [Chitinophagales bacterium]
MHKYYLKIIFNLFCVLFCAINSFAQTETIRFKHIGIDKGLSQNAVMDIAQDKNGFLWIATSDGLNRYNGHEIKVYRSDYQDTSSLISNILKRLFVDSKDRLWITSERGGLGLFQKKSDDFRFFQNHENESVYTISTNIVEDKNGMLWFAIDRSGLVQFNPNDYSFKVFPLNNLELSHCVFNSVNIYEGNIWVSLRDHGIAFFDISRQKFLEENTPDISSLDQHTRKICISDNNIFVGTKNGIYYYRKELNDFKFLEIEGFNKSISEVNSIVCSDSVLWFNSQDRGLFKYDLKSKILNIYKDNTNSKFALSYPSVVSLLIDRQNILWIGTYGGGLNKMSSTLPFKLYTYDKYDPYSLAHNSSREILKDHSNRLIVASYNGVSIFDEDKRNRFDLPYDAKYDNTRIPAGKHLLSKAVYSIELDGEDKLWIGHEGSGIQCYNFKSKEFKNYWMTSKQSISIKLNFISSIKKDHEGNILAGTMEGLFIKKPTKDKFEPFPLYDSNNNENPEIHDIFLDPDSAVFLASDNGLYFLKNDKLKFINCLDYVSDTVAFCKVQNKMKSISSINDSTLLISTSGSGILKFVYKIEDSKLIVKEFSPVNNSIIKTQTVYGILCENDSTIWFSTNTGIYRYNLYSNLIYHFTYSDGLQGNEFNSTSFYKDKQGIMYFGGINGINAFNPGKIDLKKQETKLFFESIQFGDSSITNLFNKNISKVNINYGKNPVSVKYLGLNLDRPDNINYFVQLVGVDPEPKFMGKQREVNYFNLSPKTYEMRIWAGNLNAINLSENYESLNISIIPPFYLSNWFKVIMFLLFGNIVYLIIRRRTKDLRREKERLEKQVQLRQKEIENQKLENEIATSKAVIKG